MAPPLVLGPSVVFGGFIVNLTTLKTWVAWVQWLTPTRYAFEALVWANWPDDEHHIAQALGFDLGYTKAVSCLGAMAVVSKLLTYLGLKIVARTGFK